MSEMNHNIDLEKKLKSLEPAVSGELLASVLQDVETVRTTNRVTNRPTKTFNAQLHCTKKSRFHAMIAGMLGGVCAGLLVGVVVVWGMTGSALQPHLILTDGQPVETVIPEVKPAEASPTGTGRSVLARNMTKNISLSDCDDIDRMIELAENRAKQFPVPDNRGGNYANRQYISPSQIDFNENMLLYTRQRSEF